MYIVATHKDSTGEQCEVKHPFTAKEKETLENMMWAFEGDKSRDLVQTWFGGVIKRRFSDGKWAGHTFDFKV